MKQRRIGRSIVIDLNFCHGTPADWDIVHPVDAGLDTVVTSLCDGRTSPAQGSLTELWALL